MSKTILVAGKDLPSGMKLAEGLERTDRRVAVSAGINDNENDSEEVVSVNSETIGIEWNRSSPVSSRTFVLEAESTMEQLDEAVLYFDETIILIFIGFIYFIIFYFEFIILVIVIGYLIFTLEKDVT